MQITVFEPVKKTGFFNRFENGNLHRSQSILNESRKFLFAPKGMYARYLLKYFGVFAVFIDRAIIEFQKHRLINRGNTTYTLLRASRFGPKRGILLHPVISYLLLFTISYDNIPIKLTSFSVHIITPIRVPPYLQ